MIRYITIDDEHIAHDIIKGYCDAFPNLSLVKHCYDAIEAMECLRNNEVDLIFLDLNMPKLKGFDFLRSIQNPPNVVVTTAYQEHALEGYELNIIDYLLKPFSFERFVQAINKVNAPTKKLSSTTISEQEVSIFLRSNKKMVQVKIDEIFFVESIGNYVKIITNNDEIQVREKLSDILKILPETNFLQVHKSFIVATKHIKEIEGNRIMIDDYKIPVGKTYKMNLNNLFS